MYIHKVCIFVVFSHKIGYAIKFSTAIDLTIKHFIAIYNLQ